MDNFDLTKFLKENKSLENLNPTFKSLNENKSLKDEIREMILAELNEDTTTDEAHDPVYENELEEAKKDEEKVEDVEIEDTDVEEVPAEDAPEEDAPADEAPATRWWFRRHCC
jgi:adenylosuccinate lyase